MWESQSQPDHGVPKVTEAALNGYTIGRMSEQYALGSGVKFQIPGCGNKGDCELMV